MKKNTVFLFADIVWSEKWQVILLAILICLTTVANSTSYAHYKKYHYFHDIQPYMNEAYFCSDNEFKELTRYQSIKRGDLLSLEGNEVYDVLRISYGFDLVGFLNGDEYSGSLFQIFSYPVDFKSNRILPVMTTDGRIITELKPNEILLDESAMKEYSIGDTVIFNSYGTFDLGNERNVRKNVKYQLKVVGFVPSTDYIITDAGSKIINEIYSPVKNIRAHFNDGNYYRGIISYLDNGIFIYCDGFFDYTVNGTVLIIKNGYTEEDLFRELEKQGFGDMRLLSYNYLLEKYDHDFADEIRVSRVMLIISSLLSIAVIAGSFFSNYVRKRKELALYELLGSTWSSSILLSLSPYPLSIILGTLLGWSYWFYHTNTNAGDHGLFLQTGFFILLFCIYLAFYSLMGVVYYLFFRKLNPIDQYNTKE